jgi:hypothetical protein
MSERQPITIQIETRLKDNLERAAKARNITLEAAVGQALKLWGVEHCPTCGRTTESESVPAGMTEDFRRFVEEYGKSENTLATITTLEAGEQKVYWVRIRGDREMEGMLMVHALLGEHGKATLAIGIPRGVITGWRRDPDGTWYGMCAAMGFADGNAPARQVALLMKQQGQL